MSKGAECLSTMFPLPTLLYTGYSENLKKTLNILKIGNNQFLFLIYLLHFYTSVLRVVPKNIKYFCVNKINMENGVIKLSLSTLFI